MFSLTEAQPAAGALPILDLFLELHPLPDALAFPPRIKLSDKQLVRDCLLHGKACVCCGGKVCPGGPELGRRDELRHTLFLSLLLLLQRAKTMMAEGHSPAQLQRNGVAQGSSMVGQGRQIKEEGRGFPGGSVVKNLPAKTGDMGLIPGPGRSHTPRSN